nr:DUF3344 domain-containing protein [Methanocella conradii]
MRIKHGIRGAGIFIALIVMIAVLPAIVTADNYVGGLPLTTVQTGTVSGDVWCDINPAPNWGDKNVTKTFTLPAAAVAEPGRIQWARLYISAYCGHMQNDYAFTITNKWDGNGDGVYEQTWTETGHAPFHFVVAQGDGISGNDNTAFGGGANDPYKIINDHETRVTSDYLMYYDVTNMIQGQTINVNVNTEGSYDGRIKVISLVVAYNDGDSDQIQYWINQGHDVCSYYCEDHYDEVAVGTTTFNTQGIGPISSATLAIDYMASNSGFYGFPTSDNNFVASTKTGNFTNQELDRTPDVQGAYSGVKTWDVTSLINGSSDVTFAYSRYLPATGIAGFFKLPLAILKVQHLTAATSPVAQFTSNVTSGVTPLTVQFTDQSTGSITGWAWDFDNDGMVDSTEQNPVYTYNAPGTYTVNLTVTGPGGSDSEIKTDYITVSLAAPVADFTANVTSGNSPLIVSFTDRSTGNITSWAWDFDNDGMVDSTEQNPVYNFSVGGYYTVNLTVTGPGGSNSTIKANYITAKCNLKVYTLPMLDGSSVFAKETNRIRIGVQNLVGYSPTTEILINASDGWSGRITVPEMATMSGSKYILLNITDPTIRPLQGGTVTYTAVIDPDNLVPETLETDNTKTVTRNVLYNGYKGAHYWEGKENVTTHRTYDLKGGLVYSFGNSSYRSGSFGVGGWTNYTVGWTPENLTIPAGATVREVRLYVPYTWDDSFVAPDNVTVDFNGVRVPYEHWEHDQSNFGAYSNFVYGLITYNVTDLYRKNDFNEVVFTRNSSSTAKISMYGFMLAVVYEDQNASRKQIFLNEGFDLLGASQNDYGTTEEEATAYIPFTGMDIDVANATRAILITTCPSGAPQNTGDPGEGNLIVNGQQIGHLVWSYGQETTGESDSSQVAVDVRDIKEYLNATGGPNLVGMQSTAGASPCMCAAQAFLVVEYPYEAPAANFTSDITGGMAPLTVQFTDRSTGNITSWAWDFNNDGIVDSIEQNPVHTYNAPGTYTVNLTITGPGGSDSEIKTDYITVSQPSMPDLVITAVSPNKGAGDCLFANESNLINVTVKNQGNASSAAFTVSLDIDRMIYNASVNSLEAGASINITFSDTTIRVAGSNVTVTATADSTDAVTESNETNNSLISALTVYNNGYKGKRYTGGSDISTQATFEGRIDVKYSSGNAAYNSANWTAKVYNWSSSDIQIPPGATVLSARLYQGYTWNKMTTDPAFTMSFNGNVVTPIATYKDRKGYGTSDYPQGVYVYDVTGLFNASGNSITITPEAGNNYGIYGAYLVVVYEDNNATWKKVWINDECDILASKSTYSVTSDEATAYATFAGVNNSDVKSARAIAILSSAADTGKSKFFFNGNEYTGFWQDYMTSPQIGFSAYDVKDALASGDNTARLQSYDTGNGGDSMYAQNVILVVEHAEEAPVADFTANVTSGTAPLTVQFTDLSRNATSWAWDFDNDGIVDSTEQNPVHTYASAGTYTVNLTVAGPGGSDSEAKADYITVSPSIVTISIVPSSENAPVDGTRAIDIVALSLPLGLSGYALNVSLDNASVGEVVNVSYPAWAALNSTTTLPGDNVRISGVDLNKLVEPGASNVTLATITLRGDAPGMTGVMIDGVHMDDDAGSAILGATNNGSFTVYTYVVANFTANATSGTAGPLSPFMVSFTDLTTGAPGPTSWQWNFGDGNTTTEQNPTHAYTTSGNYTVSLTAANQYAEDTKTIVDYIKVRPYVEAFPGHSNAPLDPDDDFLFEDVNGNGKLDFDDVVVLFQNVEWVENNARVGVGPYDYNHNDRIDFDDIVQLYWEILEVI